MKAAKSEEQDMDSIHSYFKSMALKSPNKLLKQPRSILNSGSKLLNYEIPCHLASEDKDGPTVAKGKDRTQEKRPALGRKRARFSLKPNSSQPFLSVEPSLDIDHLQDPEEYFLAQEKLENQSDQAAGVHHATNEPSETTNICLEQINETDQESSRTSLNGQSKLKTHPRNRRKRRELYHWQSLAEADMLWESGLRRSTRIRIRPLEYWKGERFLYGRIHDTLAMVIGLKYVSSAKGDQKPRIKVKSFVPDKYKEVVEQAALH